MTTYGLIIGTTSFGETDLPKRPEVEENTRSISRVLESLGVTEENRVALVGNRATRIGCESRLKKLCKTLQAGDVVWFYYAGYALTLESQSYLFCADTDPEDMETTAWDLSEILGKIRATGAKTLALLDVGIPQETEWDNDGELGLEDSLLQDIFGDETGDSCLCANLDEGISYANNETGLSVWTELLVQGANGAAEFPLTAKRLSDYLKIEMPKSLRKVAEGKAKQSPGIFGAESAIWVKDPPGNIPQQSSQIDLAQLKRIVFRGISRMRVKDLPGVQKGQKLPSDASPYAQKWLSRVAENDLKQDVEHLYNGVREELGFKRKELEAGTTEDGYGYIRTPNFDYSLAIAIDPDDVSMVIWRREVGHFTDASVLRSPGFRKVFGSYLDELTFDFLAPLDVESLVDQIEDRNPKGVKVRVAGDGSSCEITIVGFKGMLKVDRKRIVITAGAGANPESLLEQFFRFQNQFNQPVSALE